MPFNPFLTVVSNASWPDECQIDSANINNIKQDWKDF